MDFQECLEQIAESARSKKLSLWVGAGISKDPPASLPLGKELKFYILEKLCDHPELQQLYEERLREGRDIGNRIRDYPLEAFVERIADNEDHIISKIAELFRGGDPNKNHFLIAKLMEKGFIRTVITTNFDLLIEKALEGVGWLEVTDFYVYRTEDQIERSAFHQDVPSIFKIHGSVDNEESMRITLRDVARRTLSEKRASLLEHFMSSSDGDVLVLGYGAGDFFDIDPALLGLESKKRILYVKYEPRKREVDEHLPQTFQTFGGLSICCDSDEVVDYLWKVVLNEDWMVLQNKWTGKTYGTQMQSENWKAPIDKWANEIPPGTRFFILGSILYNIAEPDVTFKMLEKARSIFEKLGNQWAIAMTLSNLGMIEEQRGNYDEAKRLYNGSLTIKRKLGDQLGIANTLANLGMIEQNRGNYDEAKRLYNESLEMEKRLGDQLGIAGTLHQLGIIEQQRGDCDEALKLYNQSLEIDRKLGNQSGTAATLHNLGVIEQNRGNYDEAKRLYNESLEIQRKLGNQSGRASTLGQLGLLAEAGKDLEAAERFCKEAYDIFTKIGEKLGMQLTKKDLDRVQQLRKSCRGLSCFNNSDSRKV